MLYNYNTIKEQRATHPIASRAAIFSFEVPVKLPESGAERSNVVDDSAGKTMTPTPLIYNISVATRRQL